MSPQVDFKEGQYLTYNGQLAKVVRVEASGEYVYLEYGGVCHRVNTKYGIFNFDIDYTGDTFSKRIKDEVDAYCDHRIASSDEYIARKEAEMGKFKKIEAAAKEMQKKCLKAMRAILADFNATTENEIDDVAKQQEYLAFMKDKSKARRAEIRANNNIFSTANSLLSECLSKHKWINTKMVANAIAKS